MSRTLPHNLEAERAVLGAILVDAASFDVAAAVVTPAHFFRDAHARTFAGLGRLAATHKPLDALVLVEELRRTGDLEAVGGPAYVMSLTDGVPRGQNVEAYARIVREKASLRHLIGVGNKILTDAYDDDSPVDELVDRAERLVMEAGGSSMRGGDFVLAGDWMTEVMGQVEHACTTKRAITGVPTGIPSLDRMTRGLQPSDLIYLGARPSAGKTSLMLQMAIHASTHVMAGVVSAEMSRRSIGMRAVSLESRIDAFRIQTGQINPQEIQAVSQAMARLGEYRLAIDDASGQTAASIRAKVRRLASRHGLGIVFVDYMQLLRMPDGKAYENRNLEISAISAGLKDLAKELDIPIVVLSQLSRDTVKGNRRPQLHDLRDSGSLEQDADLVLLLHRPGQTDGAYQPGEEAELIVAKQRNGPVGMVPLYFVADQMRFAERTREVA